MSRKQDAKIVSRKLICVNVIVDGAALRLPCPILKKLQVELVFRKSGRGDDTVPQGGVRRQGAAALNTRATRKRPGSPRCGLRSSRNTATGLSAPVGAALRAF